MGQNFGKKWGCLALAALMAAGLWGCGGASSGSPEPAPPAGEVIFQAGLLQSLTLGYYNGFLPVTQLTHQGDTGIGTFDGVNGELILLDGVVYQALGDGSLVEAPPTETIPFATVTFFEEDVQVAETSAHSLDALRETLDGLVAEQGKNQFYMAKIQGTWDTIQVRSELKQEPPFRPLNEALREDQREFTYDGVTGTMVALYCPDYMEGLNTPGWHFHFVSQDRTQGGHVLSFGGWQGSLALDRTPGFTMALPEGEQTFEALSLAQNLKEAIQEVEG